VKALGDAVVAVFENPLAAVRTYPAVAELLQDRHTVPDDVRLEEFSNRLRVYRIRPTPGH